MQQKKSYIRWLILTCFITVIVLVIFAFPTFYLDPLFHYHKPLENWEYSFGEERYQNDGILRHYSYDAMIIGTSMCRNFKSSEFDELFGVHSVKTPFAGSGYKELGENIQRAVSYQPNLTTIILGADLTHLNDDKDYARYDSYPEYLYDNNPLNDVSYILNKDILKDYTIDKVIKYTMRGNKTTAFDDYGRFAADQLTGINVVDFVYDETDIGEAPFTNEIRDRLSTSLEQNYLPVIRDNPQIEFYIFFPPYSAAFWGDKRMTGEVSIAIEQMRFAASQLLQFENVHLFSFFDNLELTCDFNNYVDKLHYSESINSQILIWMHNAEYEIHEADYNAYFDSLKSTYLNLDYATILSK